MNICKASLAFLCLFNLSFAAAAELDKLDKIIEKNYIEFAVYESFPPFSFKGKNGRVEGIDVDIGKAIAEELGVQAGFRLFLADESVGDDLRNTVWKGHYLAGDASDVMLHVPYDPVFARGNDKVAFLQPYYSEVVAFAVNTSRIRSARTLDVFRDEPIGVEIESLSDAYLLGAFNGQLRDNVRHYTTINDAAKAMVTDEIAAIMGNRGELEFSLSQYKHDFVITKLQTPGLSVDGWELGAAVAAKNSKLAKKINEILGKLKTDGRIEAIFNAHGISYEPAKSSNLLVTSE